MSKPPRLNEEVELELEVLAYEDAPGTTAQIDLPPEAQLTSGSLTWEGDVSVNSPVRLTVSLVFTKVGEYTVQGKALRPVSADMVWGDVDYVYLTVTEHEGYFGFESGGDAELTSGGDTELSTGGGSELTPGGDTELTTDENK
jgi:hypothetical protein